MKQQKSIALHQLTGQIAEVLSDAFVDPVWVTAEVTDLRVAQNGHCYMQLIEKDARRGTTLAAVRAMVWANRWWIFSQQFRQQTQQSFQNGLKVMLCVQVQMHDQYGISLNVLDFDPSYTMGEMARRRMEILRQLREDGVIDMNRELPFPTRPQRIAVISASEAAGYGDFRHQLEDNQYGLQFYTHLFPAVMQGQQTETSVIAALERIYDAQALFDVVVIIRGGGATVDLASFDSYPLASYIANFPLPVITGIGHDRDQTVLDSVAHTSVKTPTAAAALLIDTLANELQQLQALQEAVIDLTRDRMEQENQRLQRCANAVRGTRIRISQLIARANMLGQRIQMLSSQRIQREEDRLSVLQQALIQTRQRINREQERLLLMQQTIQMAQPDNILRRGFSITRLNGHAVKAASEVPTGAKVQIQTADGTFDAVSQ